MRLVSSTDGVLAKILHAKTSLIPEEYGADCLSGLKTGLLGVQRKEFKDLIASVSDGRLAKEVGLMKRLQWPVLIVEGKPDFTTEGNLIVGSRPSRWTRIQYKNLLRSCEYIYGIHVEQTGSIYETAETICELETWLSKETHRSLLVRPKAPKGELGERPSREAIWRYILQSFPALGPDRADAVLRHFGRIPLVWTCSENELSEVDGLGKITAKSLVDVLMF